LSRSRSIAAFTRLIRHFLRAKQCGHLQGDETDPDKKDFVCPRMAAAVLDSPKISKHSRIKVYT